MDYHDSNFNNDNLITHPSLLICNDNYYNNNYIQNYHITNYVNKSNILSPRYIYDKINTEKKEYRISVNTDNLNDQNLEKFNPFVKLNKTKEIIPIEINSGKLDHRIYFNNIDLESDLQNLDRKTVKCCNKKYNNGLELKKNCNNYNNKINECLNFNDNINMDQKCLKQFTYFNNMTKRKVTI